MNFQQTFPLANRFEVRSVKEGGMGLVYFCYDTLHKIDVVLKTLRHDLLENKKIFDRFKHEALVWVSLGKHPNIVHADRLFFPDGKPHIVLEYIEPFPNLESDLRSWIINQKISLKECIGFAIQICSGMNYALEKIPGLVHRDLKPQNILVTKEIIAKITDFGLVRTLDNVEKLFLDVNQESLLDTTNTSLTRVGSIVGTVYYMSPEQCLGESVNEQSDIYALGCILFEMLTKRYLFDAKTNQDYLYSHVHKDIKFPSYYSSEITDDIDQVVSKCLEKNRESRFRSFKQLEKELNKIYARLFGNKRLVLEGTQEKSDNEMTPEEWNTRGNTLSNLGHLQEALKCYDHALEKEKDNITSFMGKGLTLEVMGEIDNALKCYDKTIQLITEKKEVLSNSQDMIASVWFNKGNLYCRIDRLKKALQCYDCALEYSPGDADIWVNRGICLSSLNDTNGAIASYDRAIAIYPGHARAYNNKGAVLFKQGDFFAALDSFEMALDIDPNFKNAESNLRACIHAMHKAK